MANLIYLRIIGQTHIVTKLTFKNRVGCLLHKFKFQAES